MDNGITQIEPVTPAAQARRPRTRLMVAILGTAVVLAASIGVSAAMASEPQGLAAGAGGPIPVEPAFGQFAACMKDHGIDLGTPVVVSSDATPGMVNTGGGPTGVSGVGGTITVNGGTPVAIDDAAFKAANDACTPILDAAGIKSGTSTMISGSATLESGSLQVGTAPGAGMIGVATAGGDVTKMADDLKAYAACMRENGVDVPDPVVDTKTGTVSMQMAGDPSSATFQAASKACASTSPLAPLPVPAQP